MAENKAGVLPTSRIDALSDGVFAIAITLLVLELDVPSPTESSESLLADLGSQWPSYLGYLVSFAFIGSVWVAHSRISKFLRAADQVFVGMNLLLLLLVSILPFTTKLMATHLNDSGERVAVVVFGANLLLAGIAVNVLLGHVVRTPDLLDPGAGPISPLSRSSDGWRSPCRQLPRLSASCCPRSPWSPTWRSP
jgi:uncharacterized membrane protein